MSDGHDFISLGIPLGSARLTISATSVANLAGFLMELNSEDQTDPENPIAPISDILDHVNTINAAVNLKMPQPESRSANTQAAQPAASTPAGNAPLCDTHQRPMVWEANGTVKTGQNAGRHFQAWKCSAPYQPGVRCGFKEFKYL